MFIIEDIQDMKNQKRLTILLWIFVGVALSIRLLLLQLPGFKSDIDSFFAWAIRLYEGGLGSFYSDSLFTDYTPGYLYILYVLGFLQKNLLLDSVTFYQVLRFPAIIAEVILALFIFIDVKKDSSLGKALFAASFILFNPGLIFNTAVWGQIDSILALLMYGAIYFLRKEKLKTASLILGLALLTKPQAIAIAPIFGLFLLQHFRFKNIIAIIFPAVWIVVLLAFPLFPANPLGELLLRVLKTAQEYPYTSLFAYNFWGIFNFWIKDNTRWFIFSYQSWGYLLFALYWLLIAYLYLKRRLSLLSLATLATLGFYFLPTRVHERYLYPALPFLIVTGISYSSRLLVSLALTLSLIYLLNLYYVYVYYNEFYFKLGHILFFPPLYSYLDNNGSLLAFLSTCLFLIISGRLTLLWLKK
jgi:Gpi18-like mannosyltransferase